MADKAEMEFIDVLEIVSRLCQAAKRWAAFQEPDSLEDQKTDVRLQSEAIEARENLLKIIDELPDRAN